MIKRLLLSGALALALGGAAHAQANNSSTWQTPGNQTVGGAVQLCPRASDGLAVPCSSAATSGAATGTAGFPAGATPLMVSQTGATTGYSVTLPASATQFTYLCGFRIDGTATAAAAAGSSITGLKAGNLNLIQSVGANPVVITESQTFSPCLVSNAINTAIVLTVFAAGAGGASGSTLWGYQQ